MTPQEIITELAEGAADLHPLIERVKRSVTRIGDAELERDVKEMISLNARTWTAVAELMHYAQIEIQKRGGDYGSSL